MSWLCQFQKKYKKLPFHSSTHAADVVQACNRLLHATKLKVSRQFYLGCIVNIAVCFSKLHRRFSLIGTFLLSFLLLPSMMLAIRVLIMTSSLQAVSDYSRSVTII